MTPAARPEFIGGPVRGSCLSPLEPRVTGARTGAAGASGSPPPLGPRPPAAAATGDDGDGSWGPPSGGTGTGVLVGTGGRAVVLVVLVDPGACSDVVVEDVDDDERPVVDVLVRRLVGPAGGEVGNDTPAPNTATTTTLPPTAAAPPMHRRSSIGLLPAMAPTRSPAGASRTRPPRIPAVFSKRRGEPKAWYTHWPG